MKWGVPGPRNRRRASWRSAGNYTREWHDGDGRRAEIGLGAAGTLHPAVFGRCPPPAGNTTRPDRRRRQARSSSAAGHRQPGRPGARLAACGRSSLTPGRAGWSRKHGSGVPPSAAGVRCSSRALTTSPGNNSASTTGPGRASEPTVGGRGRHRVGGPPRPGPIPAPSGPGAGRCGGGWRSIAGRAGPGRGSGAG
jgi:hypothetical protein